MKILGVPTVDGAFATAMLVDVRWDILNVDDGRRMPQQNWLVVARCNKNFPLVP
jgi:hypothetical protein